MQQSAEHRGRFEVLHRIADFDGPTQRFGARAHHCDRLRVALGVDEKRLRMRFSHAARHRHGFRRGGRLIEQRGIGDVEHAELADHGLEGQQSLEPPLADFGLVGRIGRVPGRILEDVALDHRRQNCSVVPLADQRRENLILIGDDAELLQRFGFRNSCRERERGGLSDRIGHRL